MISREENRRKVKEYLLYHKLGNYWRKIREQRLEIDGWCCQICGMDLKLWECGEVHHILGNGLSDDLEDLMSFCQHHHPAEMGEDFWNKVEKGEYERYEKVPELTEEEKQKARLSKFRILQTVWG